jgi:hypothetical protein
MRRHDNLTNSPPARRQRPPRSPRTAGVARLPERFFPAERSGDGCRCASARCIPGLARCGPRSIRTALRHVANLLRVLFHRDECAPGSEPRTSADAVDAIPRMLFFLQVLPVPADGSLRRFNRAAAA